MVAQAFAAIALGLLGLGGVAKLIDPGPTSGAMRAARLPASRWTIYLLGLFEVSVALVAGLMGGWAVWIAALTYAGFTAFTFAAVRNRIPVQSCGCFGREDTPPDPIHVIYNGVATISLALVAISGSGPINWTLTAGELALYGVFTATGVYASYLLMTRLPQLRALAAR